MNNKKIVAIVDSGVNLSYQKLDKIILKNLEFTKSKCNEITEINYDQNGHGTYCAGLLSLMNTNVLIYSIKILDRDNLASYKTLNGALEYLLTTDVKIINLSLCTTNKEASALLYQTCCKLMDQGKIIISATDNMGLVSYPATFNHVIGVTALRTLSNNEFWFNRNYTIQCACDSSPVIIPGNNTRFDVFGGTSKAAVLMTSFISNLINRYGDIEYPKLMKFLEEYSSNNNWSTDSNILSSETKPSFKYSNLYNFDFCKKIAEIITKINGGIYIDPREISTQPNLLEYGVNINNCSDFLIEIENAFDIKVNQPLQYYRLLNLDSIFGILEDCKYE